jgi:hypothetical protein
MKHVGSIPGALLFRSVTSIIVIVALVYTLITNIEQTEKNISNLQRENLIREMNVALSFRFLQSNVSGTQAELYSYHLGNPFELLKGNEFRVPNDYLGEVIKGQKLENPGWYFNLNEKSIFYWDRVYFEPQYQLRVDYDDLNESGRFENESDLITRLALHPVKK